MKLILWFLKGTVDVGLVFDKICELDSCVIGFVDSDYAGDNDKRRSLTSYIFTLTSCMVS